MHKIKALSRIVPNSRLKAPIVIKPMPRVRRIQHDLIESFSLRFLKPTGALLICFLMFIVMFIGLLIADLCLLLKQVSDELT